MADHYFSVAALLRKSDIRGAGSKKLLLRNIQKRLFIGVGAELLLKSVFLKSGFYINVPKKPKEMNETAPHIFEQHPSHLFSSSRTQSMHFLIKNLATVAQVKDDSVNKGLRIAKVYRNKEAHVVTKSHEYVTEDYRMIEKSIITIYKEIFYQDLTLRFSIGMNEPGEFSTTERCLLDAE